MTGRQTDLMAIGVGLAVLLVIIYGYAGTYLLIRLAYPAYDADVVGLDHAL